MVPGKAGAERWLATVGEVVAGLARRRRTSPARLRVDQNETNSVEGRIRVPASRFIVVSGEGAGSAGRPVVRVPHPQAVARSALRRVRASRRWSPACDAAVP